jgi:hypothetical protein
MYVWREGSRKGGMVGWCDSGGLAERWEVDGTIARMHAKIDARMDAWRQSVLARSTRGLGGWMSCEDVRCVGRWVGTAVGWRNGCQNSGCRDVRVPGAQWAAVGRMDGLQEWIGSRMDELGWLAMRLIGCYVKINV